MIHIDLKEDAETRLRATAKAKSMPVEAYAKELLESALDRDENAVADLHALKQNGSPQSASEALADYIGAMDSSTFKAHVRYRSAFGDILDQKYVKQGITLPEWER